MTVERPRVVAILQARVSSSRLPGKVLMPLAGGPMINFMIERICRSNSIDELVLATSDEASDDPLVQAVDKMGVRVVRGSLNDVLARFALAADVTNPEIVVRLTGDCPLIDPLLIDRVVALISEGDALYASNCVPPSYPDGLDCEAFRVELLSAAMKDASLPSDREHVTPWIRRAAGAQIATISSSVDLSQLRWTVDYADDLELIRKMIRVLGDRAVDADMFDMLRAFDQIGAHKMLHSRNEGYAKSLASE
jgi:spore coat polysaccharide biosynthesis protein SpsF